MTRTRALTTLALTLLCIAPAARIHAQASAIPSAQSVDPNDPASGHKLLDKMIEALGGDAWRNRTNYYADGQVGSFYKSAANPYVTQFERYVRFKPFGQRTIIVSSPLRQQRGEPQTQYANMNCRSTCQLQTTPATP